MTLLFTCEHAGHRVPSDLRGHFTLDPSVLTSHRGWDPGALEAARALASRFGAALLCNPVTRLVADANRSRHHPHVVARIEGFSRATLLARYWEPYRVAVEAAVAARIPCTHIAVHSFTPVLDGKARNADVGLLYDPARPSERALALRWQQALARLDARVRVRRNYPYRGSADGLPTHLRRLHPSEAYVGFELEFNQASLARDGTGLIRAVGRALAQAASERTRPSSPLAPGT